MNDEMNKQKRVLKVKGAVWRVKVGIHSPFLDHPAKGYSEIKYWKVTEYLN